MQKINKKQVKTTTKQKTLLIMFGIFLTLLILEISLRIGGFVVLSYQGASNKESFDANYRILCLGESTTAIGGKYSWPAQLEVILNNRSSKIKFKVFNEGVIGTNTAFILSLLKNNLDKYKPNMVITMMGVNDEYFGIKYEGGIRGKIALLFKDLRVYKLSKLLWAAWKNKMQSTVENAKIVEEVDLIKQEYEEEQRYMKLGTDYQEQGKFEEAEKMFKRAIEINPNSYEAYNELALVYHAEGRLEEAERIFKSIIEIDSNRADIYYMLGLIYLSQDKLEEAEEMFKKVVEINPNEDKTYSPLGHVYQEQGISNKEIEKFLYDKKGILFKVQNVYDLNITKYHYQQVYKELNKRGMKYIAMQYPTLEVNKLKDMFEENEDIIFVSNEENFKEALESSKDEDYFIDRFAGNFGHCTPEGNKLIAENVANVILKERDIEEGD